MKKLIYSMLIIILALSPVAFFSDSVIAKANENTDGLKNANEIVSPAYEYMKAFVSYPDNKISDYQNRMANRADYLTNVLEDMGYNVERQYFKYNNQFNNNATEQACNLSVTKKTEKKTDKYVIIAANYDNAENLLPSIQNSDGATANGVGVGVALALADGLKNIKLDYNVKFVFYGASEIGLLGSRFYVDHMTETEKANLLLMINIWGIGAGDNTYLYDDELHWEHYDYIYNVAKDNGIPLSKMPVDKKVILATESNIGLDYNHQALLSDSTPFIAKRLPTISFFSGNYTAEGFVQSASYGSIMGTSNDTLAKFDEIFGSSGKQKMNDAVTLVEKLLTDGVFGQMMANSIANKPDYSFFTNKSNGIVIIKSVIAALAIVAMIIAYMALKSKGEKSNDPIKPMYIDIDQFINANSDPNNINGADNKGGDKPEDPFGLDDKKDDNNPFGY